MRTKNLTELAANPDLISGIYNYCDRWCERCPFTSRCLVYATEQEYDDFSPESRDISNEKFWQKLASLFHDTAEVISEWATEAEVDMQPITPNQDGLRKERLEQAANRAISRAGRDYAAAVTNWFSNFSQVVTASDVLEDDDDVHERDLLQEVADVIQWYQYQIAVKTMRAFSSRAMEGDAQELTPDEAYSKDSDGSAKVALVGIDRSISSWRVVQTILPEEAVAVVPLILKLEKLRVATEREFPAARDFIRPGFDEVLDTQN
ncbi:MAG: hypothetical protein ABR555_01905 [Pyrinomonadaceae bacterium]